MGLKEHSQQAHMRIRYHFIANLHITETRFILFLTKYDKNYRISKSFFAKRLKIKQNIAKIEAEF